MPSISAIVPTYNRSAMLGEAVSALLGQSRSIEEILIYDDGSTDGTETVARDLVKAASGRVTYIRSENRGKSHALNAAIGQTSGDLVWICDDDDIALPDAAERLSRPLQDPSIGLSAGAHDRFVEDPETGHRVFQGRGYWPDLTEGSVLRHLLEDIFFFQNGTLVRRAALERTGPFREDLARSIDYDMFVRLAARFPVRMVEGIVFHQRKHDGARGPAAQRHAASEAEAVWRLADKRIFAEFRTVLPLSLYEAMFETEDPNLRRRAGLLQRACVYARRTDWAAAVEDLSEAAGIVQPGGLRPVEAAILTRAMSGKHGCAEAFRKPVTTQLAALRSSGPLGASITRMLARGARWRAREALSRRGYADAFRAASFVIGGGGMKGPSVDECQGADLREVREIQADAYDW